MCTNTAVQAEVFQRTGKDSTISLVINDSMYSMKCILQLNSTQLSVRHPLQPLLGKNSLTSYTIRLAVTFFSPFFTGEGAMVHWLR
jgi:hypothetical protein